MKIILKSFIFVIIAIIITFSGKSYASENNQDFIEYKLEMKVAEEIGGNQSIDEIKKSADDFLKKAKDEGQLNESVFEENIKLIYNILFAGGMVVAVIFGILLGINFMTSSVEGKAEVKEKVIAYFIGCVIIFGAFGIWKLVMSIMESVS